jgi:hypothetical protein
LGCVYIGFHWWHHALEVQHYVDELRAAGHNYRSWRSVVTEPAERGIKLSPLFVVVKEGIRLFNAARINVVCVTATCASAATIRLIVLTGIIKGLGGECRREPDASNHREPG